ncbi:gamma-glutamyltransferase family protein [Ruegeria sp. HKCCA5491]|uniref:gamma-glutamyltransferase family protein n=1 Tax=Ruegeria sp. HKCCA5491 TaxID=2682986 RepID=UPI0014893170|nr:gamma-glutamyltransferase family protein [Ruegeria sp. HKCCA5491]
MRDFHTPGRSEVLATEGMCATSHPLAAQVAVDILQKGGNAMDAAIAGAALLGICEPQMTGLGGDCFVLFNRAGENEIRALNGSGRAPSAADPQKLRNAGLTTVPLNTTESVTIPGAVDAICHLAETEGKLGLDAILQPAIHYADIGVPVAPRVAFDWQTGEATLQGPARGHYLIDGKVPKVGQVFRAPGQAEVLRQIAKRGRDAFYSGDIAQDMVDALTQMGGGHSLADFQATKCTEAQPVVGNYQGVDLVEHPPNGQGATAILLLNILKSFDLASMDPFGTERIHIEAEASKLAYDARNRFIADPDHNARAELFCDQVLADRLAALIDPKRAMPAAPLLTEAIHKDTVYITVVDRDLMAVSLIYSIFHSFGSGIASEKYGILLQNRGAGFTLEPGHPNEMGPGKRPMHTIIPGMLCENGRVTMPFGVMGGAFQPTGHARLLSNLTDHGLGLQQSIDTPRAFADAGVLKLERGIPPKVAQQLASMGHNVQTPETPLGGAQAIRIREDGVLEGGSDPRKDGCALGY